MVSEKGDVVRWVRFVNETFGPSPTHADPGNEGSASSPPNNFFDTSPSLLQSESVEVPVPSAYVDFAPGNDGFAEMSKAAHHLLA